jgi:hypothetical protein
MNTIVVYVLVIWLGAYESGGVTVIDNISSAQNCHAMRLALEKDFDAGGFRSPDVVKTRCYAVRKAVVK